MRRQLSLSLKNSGAISLSRTTSFSPTNVNQFLLSSDVIKKYKFKGIDIKNIDKAGITAVQKPDHAIARRGLKWVSAMTSAEKGTLITTARPLHVVGNSIPPILVVPRKRYKNCFVSSGLLGFAG